MTAIALALSDARDSSERAQHSARRAADTTGAERTEHLRRARVHALATRDAAQRALDLLEITT